MGGRSLPQRRRGARAIDHSRSASVADSPTFGALSPRRETSGYEGERL